MEKVAPTQQQQQQQQQIPQGLYKCPRCDSSNTKFCYYNNYSLSQPRHFCKACKRYWTRGGTLRNVPVGGGCRKNKRVKRPADASLEVPNTTTGNNVTTTSSANPCYSNIIPSSASNHINPLFYGLSSNSSELNLPFPTGFNPSLRVSSISVDGFDLQPQLNAVGLGFSSGLVMSSSSASDVENSGFIHPNKRIQDVVATSTTIPTNTIPLLPSYSSMFCSSSSSPSPTMATLLASGFLQQKVSVKENNNTSTSTPLEGLQMNGNSESGVVLKRVKVEPTGKSRLNWNLSYQNELEQVGFADPNSLYWNNNSSVVGSWDDSSNIGPSVTSLI